MMMNILPFDLQREILSYIPLLDRLEYARCNRCLCNELIKWLRIVTLRKERIEYLSSESFRNKILGLIVDPYEQLHLSPNYYDCNHPHLNNYELGLNLVQRTLFIYSKELPLLLPHITKVQHLILELEGGEDNEVTIPQISGLRQLSLLFDPRSSLREQLSQLDMRSLRYLKLHHCHSIIDVSNLGHIYELHLVCCYALVDISCLNHNKIIVIDSCPVVDYSQSFRFSRDITVVLARRVYDYSIPRIKPINLNVLEAVQSLKVSFLDMVGMTNPLSYTERLPSSLYYLNLKKINTRLVIPPYHKLKEITFSECKEISLDNLEKIRVVRFRHCHEITDWSPLQDNQIVEILHCNGFTSGRSLINVKKLTIIVSTLIKMEDLTNITHLKLEMLDIRSHQDWLIPFIESSTHGKRLFSSANRLQELELTPKPTHTDDASDLILRSSLVNPYNKRIIINTSHLNKGLFEDYHQKIMKDFGRLYEVQIKAPHKLVLIKKEQTKKEEGSVFSSWSITSIIDYLIDRWA